MKAINIKWDIDEEFKDSVDLSDEIKIPDDITDDEAISDYISDETGFCHKGYQLVKKFRVSDIVTVKETGESVLIVGLDEAGYTVKNIRSMKTGLRPWRPVTKSQSHGKCVARSGFLPKAPRKRWLRQKRNWITSNFLMMGNMWMPVLRSRTIRNRMSCGCTRTDSGSCAVNLLKKGEKNGKLCILRERAGTG